MWAVQGAREKASCADWTGSYLAWFAAVSVFHGGGDGGGDHDRRNSRSEDAGALCGDFAFRVDGADRDHAHGTGSGLLHGRTHGGSFAGFEALVLGDPIGGGLFVFGGAGDRAGRVLVFA